MEPDTILIGVVVAVAAACVASYAAYHLLRGEVVGWVVASRDNPGRPNGTIRLLVKRHDTGHEARPDVIMQLRFSQGGIDLRTFDARQARALARAVERAAKDAVRTDRL